MSAKWTFWAWEQPIKSAPKKLALLQLANNANDDGKSWYSISKMAIACGVSERTFQRSVKDLEVDHLLHVERRSNRPSIYQLKDDEVEITLHDNGDSHLQIPLIEGDTLTGQGDTLTGQGDRESPDLNSTPNTYPNSSNKTLAQKDNCAALIEQGFNIFYSAGLVKKSKTPAFNKFKLLVKNMKADPIELGELLKTDIQSRIANQQFGIDKLHPSTYLTQQRWEDDNEKSDSGINGKPRKLSAAERIRERNDIKYGRVDSSRLVVGENGGDLRGAMDAGEQRITIIDVESSPEQTITGVDQGWDSSNC